MTAEAPSPWVDLAKAMAAQAIVWHHLAFYGPMADVAWPLAPRLFDSLANDARMAVQVFFVVGGYLAAMRWAPHMRWPSGARLGATLALRYLRLVLPYAVLLGLAVAASAVARLGMDHPSISAPATLNQLVAHLLLMQDVLGVPALSAGVWYLAIDFQLFVLFALVMWVTRKARSTGWALASVVLLCAMSLLFANRRTGWDAFAIYFFGAYGLGILSAWWVQAGRPRLALILMLLLVAMALWIEWRTRIAVALLTALVLGLLAELPLQSGAWRTLVAYLARNSYSLFLVHFPVGLLVNAAFTRWVAPTPEAHGFGLLVAWAASLAVADVFHRVVEQTSVHWLKRRLPNPASVVRGEMP